MSANNGEMDAEDNVDMELVEDDATDQYVHDFETLEESNSLAKIDDYNSLLSSTRIDDKAIKIKEQCIYRYLR